MSLSSPARDLILARCTPMAAPLRTHLYAPEVKPAHAYFVLSGIVSIVSTTLAGNTAEVGIIGAEGMAGAVHLLGPCVVSSSAFMQLEGTLLRIPFNELKTLFREHEEIRDRILEFVQEHTLTVGQLAACNRLHEAEERLARWLLMAEDRTQSSVLNFTQEFLGMMLGSRRTTVSLVASGLQQKGLISYSRGKVRILDRPGLEAAACDCYPIIRNLNANLYRKGRR